MNQSIAVPAPSDTQPQLAPGARGFVRAHLEIFEWLTLAAAAPLLLFPSPYVLLGAAFIGVGWLIRRMGTGRWSVSTPANLACGVLLLSLLLSLVPSVRLDYSAPKFWGLILGLATFFTCLSACRTMPAMRRAVFGFLVAGALLAVLGVIGIGSVPEKGFGDAALAALVPRLAMPVQTSTIVTQGFNPNEVGGALTFFAPLAAAVALSRGKLRWLAIPLLPLFVAAVYLTGSRAALTGVIVALACGVLLTLGGRLAVVIAAIGAAVLMPMLVVAPDRLLTLVITDTPVEGSSTLVGRVELWQHGLAIILDAPITGVGLNTFPVLLDTLYPTIHHASWNAVPHVHNLFLQTAVDLGVPGFLAFVAIVAIAVRSGLHALHARSTRALAAGLLLGLLAHAVYSMVDAVALGAKPGPLLWADLGMLVALGGQAGPRSAFRVPRWLARVWNRPTQAMAGLAVVLLVITPVAVNAAHVALRRVNVDGSTMGLLDTDLSVASAFAWGPYPARVWATRSYVARAQGDQAAEINALSVAAPLQTWDSSLSLRLGDLRLAQGDRNGAVAAWQLSNANDTLLDRARVLEGQRAPTSAVLDWYRLAQEVDPSDWRPYAAAAKLARDPQQIAALLVEALHARGDHPAREAVALRLTNPSAPLPSGISTPISAADGDLYLTAARTMLAADDVLGAVFAAQLASQANPTSPDPWTTLADLYLRSGRPTLAESARQHAESLKSR